MTGVALETTLPDPPTAVTGVPGDSSALISWTAPDNAPVDHYRVVAVQDAYTDTFDDSVIAVVIAPDTSVLLTGLTNDVTYTVTVVAVNAAGDSDPSTPILVTPTLGAPPPTDPAAPPTAAPIDPALLPPPPEYPPEVEHEDCAFPVLGPCQAPMDVTTRPVVPPTKVGHLQSLWIEKLDNGQILYLLPSRGGLWVTGFDPGYPVIAEVSSPWPDRDGELDFTDRYGPRNPVINILAEPWRGYDDHGVLWPTQAWVELVRAWSSLDNRLRLHYQLTGRKPAYCDVRTNQYQGPITMEDLGRHTVQITWGLYSADGVVYGEPLDGYAEDPARPGWYQLVVGAGSSSAAFNFAGGSTWAGGSGQDFNGGSTWAGGAGLSFGGGSSYGGPIVDVPPETVGSRRSQPVITISGGACTAPEVSVYGNQGQTLRAKLQFSPGLVLTPADVVVIDVANRRVVRNPDRYGNGEPLYRYLSGVVDWANFYLDPNDFNAFAFGGVPADANVQAAFSWRSAFV